MKRNYVWGLFILAAVMILSGCGSSKYEPVAINEETDKCAMCSMQVKDDAYATQLTTTDGKTYKFDDIGCMNEWKGKNEAVKIGAEYVRDFNDMEWIAYKDAYYAYDPSFRSPMAYGIFAFKDESSAQAFIDEEKKGTLMTVSQLAAHSWEQNKDMMKGMDMGEGHDADSHAVEMEDGMHSDTKDAH